MWYIRIIAIGALTASAASAAELVFDGAGASERPEIVFETGRMRLGVSGADLEAISVTQDANGEPVLQFLMNEADALSFAALTGGHIGETMSVSICGQELVAPVIRERIAGGAGTIRISTMTQAEELALALAGDAPCPGD